METQALPTVRTESVDNSASDSQQSAQLTNTQITMSSSQGTMKATNSLKKQHSLDTYCQSGSQGDMLKVKAFFQKNRSKSTDIMCKDRNIVGEDLCDCDTCLLGFDDTQPDGIAKTQLKQTAVIIIICITALDL